MPSIKIDGYWFDFEPTKDVNEAKTYNGFIDPSGNFYKVNKKMAHYTSHDLWAKYFCKRNNIKNFFNKSEYVKLLRKKFGFLLYTHSDTAESKGKPLIFLPLKDFGGTNITSEQSKMLFKIMEANNELEYYPSENTSTVDDMRDKVYKDLINNEIGGKK